MLLKLIKINLTKIEERENKHVQWTLHLPAGNLIMFFGQIQVLQSSGSSSDASLQERMLSSHTSLIEMHL